MKVAIMQPYFCPYIGYFQLMGAVDRFVLLDNVQYKKGGWFNRNRVLSDGTDKLFSIPVKKQSTYLDVRDRLLAEDSIKVRAAVLESISTLYKGAPQHAQVMPLLQSIFLYETENFFDFVHHSLSQLNRALRIDTPILLSSAVAIDEGLKGQERVIAINKALGADTYINASGGRELYRQEDFAREGIALKFLQPRMIEYEQFGQHFVPWLSIIDVMMFNDTQRISGYLQQFDLV